MTFFLFHRQQESSHRLARKMLSILYLFIGAAGICIPLYVVMLVSRALYSPIAWAVWSCIESAWYFILAAKLLRMFRRKSSRRVQPAFTLQSSSPKSFVGRMDSFVIGLGSSGWSLPTSPNMSSAMQLHSFSPKAGQPKGSSSPKQGSGIHPTSEPSISDPVGSLASPEARPARHREPQDSDRKQAERNLQQSLGSHSHSESGLSPTTDTHSVSDTPLAGSSTLLNAAVSGSVQSYADLKPLQQLLRAHSMRVESERQQLAARSAGTQQGTVEMHRMGTAPASSYVWAIDAQVCSIKTGNTEQSSAASLCGAASPLQLSCSNSVDADSCTSSNALPGGTVTPPAAQDTAGAIV